MKNQKTVRDAKGKKKTRFTTGGTPGRGTMWETGGRFFFRHASRKSGNPKLKGTSAENLRVKKVKIAGETTR